MKPRPPLFAIALLSLATLAYEILLMRLFSITQWHHFAYMIISLALLGYGASGSFVTLLQRPLAARFATSFTSFCALFGLSAGGAFLLAQRLPFNALELLWDPLQPWWLLTLYLLLTVPFFFAASAIALALSHYRDDLGRLYGFDLFGAGTGGLVAVLLLFLLLPLQALAAISLLGLAATSVAAWELRQRSARRVAAMASLPLLSLALLTAGDALHLSPYKALSQTLQTAGAEVVTTRSSPLGLLTVVKNDRIPFRHVPGLSLLATQEPPTQLAVFTDGESMTAITRDSGDPGAFDYLDQIPSALPYHLRALDRVLVLGAGGGAGVLQAKYHGATRITAVELNPQLVELLRDTYGAFSGHLYDDPRVDVEIADARGFVATTPARYDLIQIPPLDGFGASGAGLYALNENYLYTVEALQQYLDRLGPDGYLTISRWIRLPPRDTLKLLVTAMAALRARGITAPGRHLVLIRGWQLATLVLKNEPFSADETAALKRFASRRAFDLAWYDGITPAEVNRYNQLARPWFYQAARALARDNGETWLQDYKFNLTPPTDDRPYFFHFFRWRSLPEILSLRGRGGMALLEQGYLVLVATLVQAVITSLLLILLPLRLLRRSGGGSGDAITASRVVLYFATIGLGFLFVEISLMQKFVLLLHHPLYAAVTVMSSFLVFAGAGSLYSQRLIAHDRLHISMRRATLAIALFTLAATLLLPLLTTTLMTQPLVVKGAIVVALIAPLAFFMGMPFPLGLAAIGRRTPQWIPWAWGINGCASVISAVLATLLAMHLGFGFVLTLAVALYLIAALGFPTPRRVSGR